MNQRTPLVYGLLLVAWGVIAGWQGIEHSRVKQAERLAVIKSATVMSSTLGQVIRSQRERRWGMFNEGLVQQNRLEGALMDLVKDDLFDLNSVALLNVNGEVIASARMSTEGTNTTARTLRPWDKASVSLVTNLMALAQVTKEPAAHWEEGFVTIVNPVDLGEMIVLPRRDATPGPPRSPSENLSTNSPASVAIDASRSQAAAGAARPDDPVTVSSAPAATENQVRERGRPDGPGRPPPGGRSPGGRLGMNEEEFKAFREKQVLHGFALVVPTQRLKENLQKDLWMRAVIVSLAGLAVFGLALAWQYVGRTSELQMRLVRASELNSHLKEMNIAAAGLAHETRNPLNIIRGVAHMIARLQEAPPEVKDKARVITDEVDRVTAQLNEFINYSRPRELRRAPVALNSVVKDVVRALDCDLEEKTIRLTVLGEELSVEADEQLLRQVLFNLLINSVQAVDTGGHIQITSKKLNSQEAVLEVLDNGPGVSNEVRQEIFKPYFTTRKTGTGLGLAVVHQIVLAHGWTIECLANTPHGAIFQIGGLKLSRA